MGEQSAANRLQNAVEKVYSDKRKLTPDVGGTAGTAEFTEAVIAAVAERSIGGASPS